MLKLAYVTTTFVVSVAASSMRNLVKWLLRALFTSYCCIGSPTCSTFITTAKVVNVSVISMWDFPEGNECGMLLPKRINPLVIPIL
jgi:hypothetical protein